MKTIGIAICAYKGHIPQLKTLLESIEKQTKKPDMVIVSCSSSEPNSVPYRANMYSFPLIVITHRDKKNAAQNRNFAARLLQTDIICFFDADDIMHPQRIEIIHNCFTIHDCKIFLHNTSLYDPTISVNDVFTKYDAVEYIINRLGVCPYGTTILHKDVPNMLIANGHVSISTDIFSYIQFNDTEEYYGREDTKFCTDVIRTFPIQTAYCNSILSYYIPSRTGGYIC